VRKNTLIVRGRIKCTLAAQVKHQCVVRLTTNLNFLRETGTECSEGEEEIIVDERFISLETNTTYRLMVRCPQLQLGSIIQKMPNHPMTTCEQSHVMDRRPNIMGDGEMFS
jgi:hypothetical protein